MGIHRNDTLNRGLDEQARGLEACRPQLTSYLHRLTGDPCEAEEIVQETLMRAWQKLSLLKDREKLMPWLYRMATNRFVDMYRKKTALKNPAPHTQPYPNGDPDRFRDENAPQLHKLMECREMSDCVQKYLTEISHRDKAVVFLHDMEGLTHREIAEALKISVHAAKIRLHRARKRLRALLTDVCDFHIDERGILVCERKKGKQKNPDCRP